MVVLKGFVSRSAFLYFDLLQQAVDALGARTRTLAKRLGERNLCMICEINPHRRGWLSDSEISEARDQGRLRASPTSLRPFGERAVVPAALALKLAAGCVVATCTKPSRHICLSL